ncbi:MAG: hypothetical protein JWQ08_2365, partial [Deinococcus sp.]|nr:hypothetical protein [Deinococcus sp.]
AFRLRAHTRTGGDAGHLCHTCRAARQYAAQRRQKRGEEAFISEQRAVRLHEIAQTTDWQYC